MSALPSRVIGLASDYPAEGAYFPENAANSSLVNGEAMNMTVDEWFASLPVFDMFPLSNWDNNHMTTMYAVV